MRHTSIRAFDLLELLDLLRSMLLVLALVVPLALVLGAGCGGAGDSETGDSATGGEADGAPAPADSSAAATLPAPDDPSVVATFKGGVILRSEFDSFVGEQNEVTDKQVAEESDQDWRIARLQDLVVKKMLAAEVPVDDPDPVYQRTLERAKDEVLAAAMKEELGWNSITSTPEEIRRQYDTHPEQYKDPEKRRMQHIFLRAERGEVTPEERAGIRRRLERVRGEIEAGADFAEMARRYSNSEDSKGGGWMVLKADADVFPAFFKGVWDLDVDQLSDVIDIPTGFELAVVRHRIPARDRPFEDVVTFARRRSNKAKLDAMRQRFIDEVGPRYHVERHYDRLLDPFIPEDEPLAIVGGRPYTFTDLESALGSHYQMQLYSGYLPNINESIDDAVINELLVLEAERLGLAEREAVASQLAAAIENVRASRGLNVRLFQKAAAAPEEELREYYEQNKQRYQTLRTFDLDVVLIKPEPDEALWLTLKRAQKLVDRIRAGEDFAAIARQYSQHYSAKNGGRIERVTEPGLAQIVQPRIRNLINSLQEGEITDAMVAECYDPAQLTFLKVGAVFVRLVKDYPPVQADLPTVIDRVRKDNMMRNYQKLEEEIQQEMLAAAALRVFPERLPPI